MNFKKVTHKPDIPSPTNIIENDSITHLGIILFYFIIFFFYGNYYSFTFIFMIVRSKWSAKSSNHIIILASLVIASLKFILSRLNKKSILTLKLFIAIIFHNSKMINDITK